MSISRLASCSICVALTFVVWGCVSPRAHLFLFNADQGAAADPTPNRDTVLLGPTAVPPEVDRPQIVVTEAGNEVSINEQQRWAQPLKEAIPRLLATELSRASPYRVVVISSGTAGPTKARLAMDINRFEVSREHGATVAAHWLFHSPTWGRDIYADSIGRARIETGGYAGLVDALQRATSDLARQMGAQLTQVAASSTTSR